MNGSSSGRRFGRDLSNNYQPGLGRQLSSRVQSGAITQEQAQHTAQERRQFEQAYGPNWRAHVYGENVGALRQGLAGAQKGDPQYEAAYKAMMERRKKMLERARTKLNGGTTAPGY